MPIESTVVEISDHCIGDRWIVSDEENLAELVAIIAKCQFAHAQNILLGLPSADFKFSEEQEEEIKQDIIKYLTVPKEADGSEKREGRKWHRDGFLFEAISWIVARKNSPNNVLMRDPHITATTQGLDGLMLELSPEGNSVTKTTVMEDKCVESPAATFKNDVLPAFGTYHKHNRKVLESVTSLLRGYIPQDIITPVAQQAISKTIRSYRASFPVKDSEDTVAIRAAIFKGYDQLDGLEKEKRIGGTFLASEDIRNWFENFAKKVISKL